MAPCSALHHAPSVRLEPSGTVSAGLDGVDTVTEAPTRGALAEFCAAHPLQAGGPRPDVL